MIAPGNKTAAAAASVAFMVAVGESFNVMSALNSSPWSAENFAADDQMAKSAMEYVKWTAAINSAMGAIGSYLAESPWPFAGVFVATLFAWWLYRRALKRGIERKQQQAQQAQQQGSW